MFIKNNSNKEWLGYNCGSVIVDIKANSTFEIDEKAGRFLLRVLGHKNWLEEDLTNTITIKTTEDDSIVVNDEIKSEIETYENKEIEIPFCEYCTSKGGRHKKDCTRPIN